MLLYRVILFYSSLFVLIVLFLMIPRPPRFTLFPTRRSSDLVPLQQLAGFNVPEARLLVIQPYDKNSLKAIEKSIQNSDLGINPSTDGQVIRLAFPQLTEERRKELVKVVKHKAEEGRVAVRNLRRSARHELEALEKDGHVSSDDLERAEKELEKLTHEYVEEIDRMVQHKEHELLEV